MTLAKFTECEGPDLNSPWRTEFPTLTITEDDDGVTTYVRGPRRDVLEFIRDYLMLAALDEAATYVVKRAKTV